MNNHDIMIHGIPNVADASIILRDELDQYQDRFGAIRWLRMGVNRNCHRTNYAFLRYQDPTIHQEAVEFLNRNGIDGTNIWFEINPRPTEAHHLLQETPACPRVARQLAELERIRAADEAERQQQLQQQQDQLDQMRLDRDRVRARAAHLEADKIVVNNELNESRELVRQFLNQEPQQPERRARWTDQWAQNATPRNDFMPLDQLAQPPTTKSHKFEGGNCPICLESFEECLSIVSTQCGHLACEQCMHHHVRLAERQVRDKCPTCRSKLGYNYYSRIIYN